VEVKMSKEQKSAVTAAWITGILGCLGALITAGVAIFVGFNQKEPPQSPDSNTNITVVIPTAGPILPTTEPSPALPETTLRVINNTTDAICYFYMVPVGSESWGSDWLGEDQKIETNQGVTFTADTGMYHLRAENCEQEVLAESSDQHIEGDMHWVVQAADSASTDTVLEVNNNTSQNICYLYIAASASDNWGQDWLGTQEIIYAGENRTFTVETGMYDLRAQNCQEEVIAESFDNHLQGSMEWNLP
jgi:hypothetical protein